MKKLFKNLKQIRIQIKNKKIELKGIDELHYYHTVGKSEKERDRLQIEVELLKLIKSEFLILEKIQMKAEYEKAENSFASRSLTIKINSNERLV